MRCKVIPDNAESLPENNHNTFYIMRYRSVADLFALKLACKVLNLPDPTDKVAVGGKLFSRTLYIANPRSLLPFVESQPTKVMTQGRELLQAHAADPELDVKLIPANILWGRGPNRETTNMATILAEQESPNWLIKLFIVLLLGRDSMARFSQAVSLRYMHDNHGTDESTAKKLLRVARAHFHRQKVAATGPRLLDRQQTYNALFASPAIKSLIKEEAQSKNIDEAKVKKQAQAMMKEITSDYRDSYIRLGERVLSWLWNRLYSGINVRNPQVLRDLAQKGHEIIYVPCHRSHMDYLLLTYVIYHEGLVTPRIAAGINLNFWPAGPIFRRSGAFFIRRSFRGNRMYSTIFREYLAHLFEHGYPVKYYSEGGRSRTGRLLQPKTGMLAMTIQSLLKGIDRPLTFVPVYIGYEHVMEVGTYHKELRGSAKKNESVLGVFKAIRNLRDYGKGYVTFGEPLNLNEFLNNQVEDWREAIDPIEASKPSWLTPTVNQLANRLMTSINEGAALNAVAMAAQVLLSCENNAIPKQELIEQLDFMLAIQRAAPYSDSVYVPDCDGAQLVEELIALRKVDVRDDSLGAIISLNDSSRLEMTYYRNNILHCFIVPGLVCRILAQFEKLSGEQLNERVFMLFDLMKHELFLCQAHEQVTEQVQQTLTELERQGVVKLSKAGFWSLQNDSAKRFKLALQGEVISETMQRYAIVLHLLKTNVSLARGELEKASLAMAKRLSVLHNINAPEFIDKKAQASVVNSLRDCGFINTDNDGCFQAADDFDALSELVFHLLSDDVLQSVEHAEAGVR